MCGRIGTHREWDLRITDEELKPWAMGTTAGLGPITGGGEGLEPRAMGSGSSTPRP